MTVFLSFYNLFYDFFGFFLYRYIYSLVLNYVYSKQPIFGLTQEWLREVWSLSRRLIVYHSSSIHSPRLDVHTMTVICKLIGIWLFHWSTAVLIGIQTRRYQPGTVLSSWESEIPSHHGPLPGRCEDKPSPACEHAVPNSRAELLIRKIAETNMAMWALCRPGQLWQKPGANLIRRMWRWTF